MKNNYPIKITPCPIHEAVFELRFDSDFPDEAIFGVVYNELKGEYGEFEQLPILQIPDYMRKQDKQLQFSPYYKMENEEYVLKVGPKVVSLSNKVAYQGWPVFENKIKEVFDKYNELKVINKINRVALRYINSFEKIDVFRTSNLKVTISNEPIDCDSMNVTSIFKNNNVTSNVKVINGAIIQNDNEEMPTSIVDIDSYVVDNNKDFFATINDIHDEEKRLFYLLIGSEILNSLNPEYNNDNRK